MKLAEQVLNNLKPVNEGIGIAIKDLMKVLNVAERDIDIINDDVEMLDDEDRDDKVDMKTVKREKKALEKQLDNVIKSAENLKMTLRNY